jgi:hypothetical protein
MALFYFFLPNQNYYKNIINVFKVLRVVLVVKLLRYSKSLQLLLRVIRNSSKELFVLLVYVIMGMVLFSSFIYIAEQAYDKDTIFTSIPYTFWYGIITMTTVIVFLAIFNTNHFQLVMIFFKGRIW